MGQLGVNVQPRLRVRSLADYTIIAKILRLFLVKGFEEPKPEFADPAIFPTGAWDCV